MFLNWYIGDIISLSREKESVIALDKRTLGSRDISRRKKKKNTFSFFFSSLIDHPMNSLQLHCCLHFLPPQHRLHLRCSTIFTPRTCRFLGKISFRESFITKANAKSFTCFAQSETKQSSLGTEETSLSENQDPERPPFDINQAVILAGFAFESYATPPVTSLSLFFCESCILLWLFDFSQENIGKREINAAGCNTLYLSEYVHSFHRRFCC